jgi:hypothetical protein
MGITSSARELHELWQLACSVAGTGVRHSPESRGAPGDLYLSSKTSSRDTLQSASESLLTDDAVVGYWAKTSGIVIYIEKFC